MIAAGFLGASVLNETSLYQHLDMALDGLRGDARLNLESRNTETRMVNVLFSAKYSEVPVFTGIFGFQQNLRFFKFNFWGCYQAAVDRSLPISIALSSGNS